MSSWRKEGNNPDYRFSLANERTYLAWIRTSLALLAGAIGLDQFTPDFAIPSLRIGLSAFLCLSSGLLAIFAYRRWADNEKSMRNNVPMRYTSFLKIISAITLLISLAVVMFILL